MAKEREKARKAQVAATRQEQQQRQRRATLIRRSVLGAVLLAAIELCVFFRRVEREV